MKKYFAPVFSIALLIVACKNEPKKNSIENAPEEKVPEKKKYFPVTDFIKKEIRYVDSLPLAIIKYNIESNKSDSVFIKPKEFNSIAQEFLPAQLFSPSFEEDFTETSFMDETTQSVTFTYSTPKKNEELRHVDVLVKPTPGLKKVKSVYMEKIINKNDTLIIKKMIWKARRNFNIITSIQPLGQKAVIKQLKIVWDDRD
jgi:hypothetical protein